MVFDVVYINGGPTIYKDVALLYSLRSLERHGKEIGQVFLIGRKPDFVSDQVIHIPHNDIFTNKAKNIMEKIKRASTDSRISKDFVFLNDDYFFTNTFDPNQLPYYYKCEMKHTVNINPGEYGLHVKATIEALRIKGHPHIKNFDTHKPIIYSKRQAMKVIDQYIWDKPFGYTFKSLYCNTLRIEGEFKTDHKIVHTALRTQWHQLVKKSDDMFSTGDKAMNEQFKAFLAEYYPEKSRYEI